MRAVLDTNVWVSGLAFPAGPPGRILHAVRTGRVRAIASWSLVEEIVDVLHRPAIRDLGITQETVVEVLLLLAPFLPEVEFSLPVRDPKDARVVASALDGGAEVIVTGDGDLLDDAPLRSLLAEKGIAVESPAEFLRRLGG